MGSRHDTPGTSGTARPPALASSGQVLHCKLYKLWSYNLTVWYKSYLKPPTLLVNKLRRQDEMDLFCRKGLSKLKVLLVTESQPVGDELQISTNPR